jgi:hypothetical protein
MVNLLPHIRDMGVRRSRWLNAALLSILGGYGAYRYWRGREITYQVDVATEFCPGDLRTFSACLDSKKDCSTEMIYLHDCIYRQRGHGQVTFNQAKIK